MKLPHCLSETLATGPLLLLVWWSQYGKSYTCLARKGWHWMIAGTVSMGKSLNDQPWESRPIYLLLTLVSVETVLGLHQRGRHPSHMQSTWSYETLPAQRAIINRSSNGKSPWRCEWKPKQRTSLSVSVQQNCHDVDPFLLWQFTCLEELQYHR